ncbi:creatinine amidohydrolase [Amycolatopsis bartoniae]|uniref:Creatininase n=1 Tax=Amycolatopsis bartoniae TaxID=941986 RepID=A0A8H9IQY9_9PSEU|nr:creatininase family protein [Amycolatopsis bartoniae]MBB2937727.1 creatinine amidohydrolase [Amycolatopsis bartoniae]TVT08189.1 creatininase family protein [Amycolatopsis bartoniae]GHF40245.1 creatininase [Amycolatopsis bartoniae]
MVEHRWNRLTAPRLRELAAQDAVVLLPVGSTEQHGEHLPTGVDDFLATEVCRRAAALASVPVVVAPSVSCGLAEHHMAFGGTLTLSLSTLHALLRDVCRSILRAGFRRILLVNGHGGNVTALQALVPELTAELAAPIAVTSYFTAGRTAIAEVLETQSHLMHACEGETSMALAAFPELVRTDLLPRAAGPAIALQAEDPAPVHRFVPFGETTANGVAGDARTATADKGAALLDGCARALADLLVSLPAT